MNCKHFRKRNKNYTNYFYCTTLKKEITFNDCKNCKYKEYKIKIKYKIKQRTSKQAKKLDISQKVKKIVFERDNGCCVICGNSYNVMPNSHYIRRSKGGLGIEQNVFTACTNLTEKQCHYRWENHKCSKEEINKVIDNFKRHYFDWCEENLRYKKR